MSAGSGDRPRMLLDCDPGLDDAVAILTAAHYGDLVGITTVSGNVGLDHTTRNALAVAELAGLDVPVHRGAARPLVAPAQDAARVHGPTGLGDAVLPEPARSAGPGSAADFISEKARAVDGLHLVAVGPLTNVALALRNDPDLAGHLAGITVMGGSAAGGNVTAAAEFNVWADPEAAAIVFAAAAPATGVTMVGLDATGQVLFGPPEADRMRASGTPAAALAADLVDYAHRRCLEAGRPATPLHDAVAVIAVTHPRLFTTSRRPVAVELRGEHTRGMTVVDDRPGAQGTGACDVVREVQADRVKELIIEAVTAAPAA